MTSYTWSSPEPPPRPVYRNIVRKPLMVYVIIAVCVVSFLLQKTLPETDWTLRWLFAPFIADAEPWRFITAGFLHADWLHLAFNMFALWSVGTFLEPQLGRLRFTALFLISALGGSVAVQLLADPNSVDWFTGVLGASGGVFGLFAATFFVMRQVGGDTQQILVVIGINLIYGFVFSGISWQGHVGGLIVGAILGWLYTSVGRRGQPGRALLGSAGVVAALVIAVIAKYATAPELGYF